MWLQRYNNLFTLSQFTLIFFIKHPEKDLFSDLLTPI